MKCFVKIFAIDHSFRSPKSLYSVNTSLIKEKSMNPQGISPEEASEFIDKQLKGGIGEKYIKVN